MKKIFLVLSLGVLGSANAQTNGRTMLSDAREQYARPQRERFQNALVLIDGVIGSTRFLTAQSQEIKAISVYKSAENLPAKLQPFAGMVKYGIIDIRTKKGKHHSKTIALADLNKKFGLPENQSLYVDNLKIDAPQTRIFTDMLKDISVKNENGERFLLIYSTPKLNSEIKL